MLEWSPDGKWLALRNSDGKVAIRDAKTLEVTKTFASNVPDGVSHPLAWLPDSQRLVVVGEGSPSAVFNTTTGEQLATFELSGTGFYALALRANGTEVVGQAFNRLFFYDTSTGQKLREGKERGGIGDGPSTMSRDGRELYSGRTDIFVSDAATGERLRHIPLVGFANPTVTPSPDDTQLAASSHPQYGTPTVLLVDARTGNKRHELSHDKGNVTRVAWSPDGKWLATGATDKLVRVWNVATGKIEHELAGHTGTIWSLAWSPDGTRLASAAEDKTVRLWEVTDPTSTTRERVVEPEKTTRLRVVLKATYDQFPEAMVSHKLSGDSLSWATDSRRLWIALGGNIVPLDVETGTFGPLENFSNGANPSFLGTSPDGQRRLVWDHYGWTFVRGRDAQDRRLLGQHLGWTAQWHPDSRRFLGWEYYYGTVGFDVETNRRLGLLFPWLTGDHWLCLGPTGHYRGSPGVEDQIVYVAMLPDGSQRTYTPAEFAKTFHWKNNPEKAELLGK